MVRTRVTGTVQISEDLEFEHRSWLMERIGWAVMTLIVVLAIAGLFGSGPLSSAIAGQKGGELWVEYNRFERLLSPTQVRACVGAAPAGELRLSITREYLERVHVQEIMPPPKRVEAAGDWFTFVFHGARAGSATSVTFYLKPNESGRLRASIRMGEMEPLSFGQLVFP